MLLLWAGSAIAFQLMRDAITVGAHAAFRASGTLYELPTALLFVFIADELFLPKPRTPRRRAALAALGACTLVAGALLMVATPWAEESARALRPGDAASTVGGQARFDYVYSNLPVVAGVAVLLAEAVVVAMAIRAAVGAPPGSVERRRAVAVALAFGFLAGHNGGLALASTLRSLSGLVLWPDLPHFLVWLGQAAGLAAVGYASARLLASEPGRGRAAALALLAAPVAAGAFDGGLRDAIAGLGAVYSSSRFAWLSAFAVGLAVAVLRYDIAGVGTAGRERRALATSALLAAGVAGVVAGGLVSALGETPPVLLAGALVVATPTALALGASPLRRRLAAALSLDPRDPGLDPERVRIYAAALRTAAAERGAVPPAGDEGLAELRRRLGLGLREHELLAFALDTRAVALGPGTLLLGRYRIARELGRGGFGEAWLARDERAGREVVLKRLAGERSRDARAIQRFQREQHLAASVEHPHIVAVHGTEAGPDGAYLVMEYLAGGSLADRLRASSPLDEEPARAMAHDVLQGLAALHTRGIVHRDVKPGNVLFTAEGRAKLGDFTIAREVVSGATEDGAGHRPAGTLAYLAPEQARGMPATPASDLYGLGATVYEALSGRPPVDLAGLTDYEAAVRVAGAAPELPLRGASKGLNSWLARALARDPARRFRDAAEAAAALPAAAGGPSGTRAGSAPRPRRRAASAGPGGSGRRSR